MQRRPKAVPSQDEDILTSGFLGLSGPLGTTLLLEGPLWFLLGGPSYILGLRHGWPPVQVLFYLRCSSRGRLPKYNGISSSKQSPSAPKDRGFADPTWGPGWRSDQPISSLGTRPQRFWHGQKARSDSRCTKVGRVGSSTASGGRRSTANEKATLVSGVHSKSARQLLSDPLILRERTARPAAEHAATGKTASAVQMRGIGSTCPSLAAPGQVPGPASREKFNWILWTSGACGMTFTLETEPGIR